MAKNNKNKAIMLVCGIFISLSVLCFMYRSELFSVGFIDGNEKNIVSFTKSGSEGAADNTDVSDGGVLSDGESGDERDGTSFGQDEVAVHLCGAVKHPGVYRLPAGSRVCDAVELAGGLKKTADVSAVNQARAVTDGEQIEFPDRKQANKKGSGNKASGAISKQTETMPDAYSNKQGLVNINTAELAELMTLSGIGESRAKSIIDYRTENGSFAEIKDIMKVTGIKDGIYKKIKDSITV